MVVLVTRIAVSVMKRTRVEIAVLNAIDDILLGEPLATAAAIRRELAKRALEANTKFTESEIPSPSTLQRVVNDRRISDPSGAWGVASSDPDEVSLVLPVLAAVTKEYGMERTITNSEAGSIVRVLRAAPDLAPIEVYRVARIYVRRAARKEGTGDLDLFLAWAPWRDEESGLQYYRAGGEITRLGGRFGRIEATVPTVTVGARSRKRRPQK